MTFTSFVLFILVAGSSILTAENPESEKVPFKSNPKGDDSNEGKIASENKNMPTFEQWVANGQKLPEGMMFLGGSPWFNESTGQKRTAEEVYKMLYGKKEKAAPPKPSRPLSQPGKPKPFPGHWGDPPKRQTRDLRPLPGGYGMGSGTLANWIQENLDRDQNKTDPRSL